MVLADAAADPRRVAADLVTQAEHGPDSPAILVTTDAAFADAVEAAVAALLAGAAPPRRSSSAPSPTTAGSSSRPTSTPRSTSSTTTRRSTCRSTSSRSSRPSRGSGNAGSIFVGPWAPESAGDYATGANHVLPTGGLARACGALAVEAFGKFIQVQRLTREGLAGIRDDDRRPWPRPRACSRTATPSRSGSATSRPDEPDARHVQLADRARLATPGRRPTRRSRRATASRSSTILRFDLNTSPAPPELAGRLLAGGPLRDRRCPSTRRPTTAGSSTAAAARYGVAPSEILVGAGADEILDLVAKAFLPPGGAAVVPTPDLRDVPRRHRAARRPVVAVPRLGAGRRLGPRPAGGPRGRRGDAAVVWLCSPNNPTGLRRARRRDRGAARRPAADAAADRARRAGRGPRRGLRRVRRPLARSGSATRYPRLSSSAPRARPTRWPACASGSRSPVPRRSPRIAPVPAAGLGRRRSRSPS